VTEVCPSGHTRTPENTAWRKHGRGEKLRRVCKDCHRGWYTPTGIPAAHERQVQLTDDRHEDIEDLLRFGATLNEVVQRAGYSSLTRLKRSLKHRNRTDLLEQIEAKQTTAA